LRLPVLSAALLAAVLTGPLCAPQPATAAEGEQLYVAPPAGWTVGFHKHQGNIDVTEVLPPNQTVQAWSEMLVVQVIGDKPSKGPQDLLKDQLDQINGGCDDVGAGPVNLAIENGYQTALRVIACTKLKQVGKGELGLYKVLMGRDRTYIVQRSWRGQPFDKEHQPLPAEKTQEWLSFMHHVVLCDTRDNQRPCPRQ